jgi:eukaryotic-like serine/threonine-protein kinase
VRRRVTGDWGVRFGRYVLLERIGAGGMAEVFRAVAHGAEGFQRTFVLKRIRSDRSESSSFVDMFVNEARLSALLDHENIVKTYDFGEVDGCYFLTMEYLRGYDLATILRELLARNQGLEPVTVAFIALQVARGLAYAHALTTPAGAPLNIVHRDVTPSNIMLLRSGGVKLLDFGIAKTKGEFKVGENTETGVCKGKLPYLSPEQVEGHALDHRCDLFTLGVVMWEALTGKRLFLGRTDYETMQNVLERPVPAPSSLRPGIPAALDEIVLTALERRADDRFPDARTLGNALETVVQDMGYRSEAVPRLLDDLFGREDNSVSLTPADLPTIDVGPAGSWPSQPHTRKTLTRRDPDVTPATGATAFRQRRRRWALVATATLFSLLCLLLGGRWLDNRTQAGATQPAVQLAARPLR